jgi:hypothetical protein
VERAFLHALGTWPGDHVLVEYEREALGKEIV